MQLLVRKLYYLLRPYIPIRVRWKMQEEFANKKNGFYTNPMWPIPESPKYDEDFQNFFSDKSNKLPFVLTHDVDTAQGFNNIIEVAKVEQKLGFKSSWNIVPNLYEINFKIIDALKDMGMEVGVHDWNHDGKLFSNREIFMKRVQYINDKIAEWDAKGFRAGMAFHHNEWTQEINSRYDSSFYDTDPYQPLAGGCSYITPFLLGKIVEIPYTIPQDHVIFVAKAKIKIPEVIKIANRDHVLVWIKGYTDKNNVGCLNNKTGELILCGIGIWKMKFAWLIENRGAIVMITHPDYLCSQHLPAKLQGGYFIENDSSLQFVRKNQIIASEWQNSLLEQYAAFLVWCKKNYHNQIENYLAEELGELFLKLKSNT